jgi:hypothetical protein
MITIVNLIMDTKTQREIVSSSNMLSLIQGGVYNGLFIVKDGILVINNLDIRDSIKINGSQTNLKQLILNNCRFCDSVNFVSYSNIENLIFDNCCFEKEIVISNLQIPLEFRNQCSFKDSLIISSLDRPSRLNISDIEIGSKLSISGPLFKATTLRNINIGGKKKGEVELTRSTFKRLDVSNIHVLKFAIINETIFQDEANFENIYVDDFILNGCEIGLKLRLLASELSNLLIDNLRGNRDIEIFNTTVKSKALIAIHMLNRTSISDCPFIGYLQLWGTNNRKDTFLNLEKVSLKKLHFDKIYNEGIITLKEINIQENGVLSIHSSSIGRTDFILCDFSKAILEFENSKIADSFLSETDFPNAVKIGNDINHAQAQLAFGQLHTAFQKQGDTVRSLEYQSREIEAHYRKLKWFITKKKPYVNITWLNLWLNKVSNNFGRNWFRALIFSILIGIIFFYSLVLSTKEYHFGLPITLDSGLIKSFFKFMNPLRFFETDALFQKSVSLSAWSYLFDFAGRIFIAYGFYQTIQAFRRFGRK